MLADVAVLILNPFAVVLEAGAVLVIVMSLMLPTVSYSG